MYRITAIARAPLKNDRTTYIIQPFLLCIPLYRFITWLINLWSPKYIPSTAKSCTKTFRMVSFIGPVIINNCNYYYKAKCDFDLQKKKIHSSADDWCSTLLVQIRLILYFLISYHIIYRFMQRTAVGKRCSGSPTYKYIYIGHYRSTAGSRYLCICIYIYAIACI